MSRVCTAVAIAALGLPLAACGSDDSAPIPQPSPGQMKASGLAKLPMAEDSERVDLTTPEFSDSTEVTNPLFPISDLHSAVLNGRIDNQPFHTETTLLPYTRTIDWPPGHETKALVSQYVAFLDGRIQEVALDYYAQSDDNAVWYFGEDVNDYNPQGFVAFTTDSWLAGRDGPAAMIMPGAPQVGDAFRTENVPGKVFEEVTVKTLDKTVPGPAGQVHGAMVGSELHDDGMRSDKTFAPGYGEFFTKDADGVEAMALAVPTDALDEPAPPDLESLLRAGDRAWTAVDAGDWPRAGEELRTAIAEWDRFRAAEQVPPRLAPPMKRAIASLGQAVAARDAQAAGTGAIDVSQAGLDLELRYRPPVEIDLARFEQWTRQLLTDARAHDLGRVRGDLVTLQLIRARIAEAIDPVELTRIDTELLALQDGVENDDFGALQSDGEKLRAAVG